jgi:hypothetical protein
MPAARIEVIEAFEWYNKQATAWALAFWMNWIIRLRA